MWGDSQVERITAPKPKEEFTGMMGNLARALDERHKVMHSSGKSQDTTAQSIRSYNHTLQLKHASTPPPPKLNGNLSGRRCLHQNIKSCTVCICSQW